MKRSVTDGLKMVYITEEEHLFQTLVNFSKKKNKLTSKDISIICCLDFKKVLGNIPLNFNSSKRCEYEFFVSKLQFL